MLLSFFVFGCTCKLACRLRQVTIQLVQWIADRTTEVWKLNIQGWLWKTVISPTISRQVLQTPRALLSQWCYQSCFLCSGVLHVIRNEKHAEMPWFILSCKRKRYLCVRYFNLYTKSSKSIRTNCKCMFFVLPMLWSMSTLVESTSLW